MRIGMILDAPFPPDYRVEKEALSLLSLGHEVCLFCLTYEDNNKKEDYKGIKIIRYRSNKLEYKLSALAYTIPFYHQVMARKINKFVREFSPDILHVHDMVVAKAGIEVAKKNRIKVVLDLHENRPAIMQEYRHIKRFPGKYLINLSVWAAAQNKLVEAADKVIVVTEMAKRELLSTTSKTQDDIHVLPNTPSITFLKYQLDPDVSGRMAGSFNLLYVGDTSERRGTLDMLFLVADVKKHIPEIVLWLVGTSSFDQELKNQAKQLNVEKHVRFEGWQPERLFPSYITSAHICLSPLKRNPHHDTTFANKIFQYMSVGRPLVVSDCPAQAEVVIKEACGLVYNSNISSDFSRKIMELYDNPQLRTDMGDRAKLATQERWTWEKTSSELGTLYMGL